MTRSMPDFLGRSKMNRLPARIIAAVTVGATVLLPIGAGLSATGSYAAHHSIVVGYSTIGQPPNPGGPVAEETVTATISSTTDGGSAYTYVGADGMKLVVSVPPVGFDPMLASSNALAEYGFPQRPNDATALVDWTRVMSSYRSDSPPPSEIQLPTGAGGTRYSVHYNIWAGYTAGSVGTTGHTYIGVKGEYTIPTISGTACGSSNQLAGWIGLGGTTGSNDLVQQGLECGNSNLGSGSAWRAWTEFANTQSPIAFCGYSSWTFPAGDVVYQNMGYEMSLNQANFFVEDITTGVSHSCSISQPGSNWSFNGNTADWEMETPSGAAADFGTLKFVDANAELDSTGSWVTLGSQTTDKWIDGVSSTSYCISPQGILSDNQSFNDAWSSGSCY